MARKMATATTAVTPGPTPATPKMVTSTIDQTATTVPTTVRRGLGREAGDPLSGTAFRREATVFAATRCTPWLTDATTG